MKYIFVTGGVVSGLGKGITAASLGRLLKARGYKVASQKLDPYINIDPGTMSPYQHGEVFVTDDGAETDLDLGHHERFSDENLNKFSNLTTGKVYWNVLKKERNGEYTGQVVCGIRSGGRTLYRPIGKVYPDVLKEKDKFPTELSCADASLSAPQSIAANITAATAVVDMIYNILALGDSRVRQVTFAKTNLHMRPTLAKMRRKKAG